MPAMLSLHHFLIITQQATEHPGPSGIYLVVWVDPIISCNGTVEKEVRKASENAVGDQDGEPRS